MKNFFSNNLKHLRIQSGMTQADLAKKLNKDYSTVGKWELGERTPTTLDLFKIADIFNIEARDIFDKDLINAKNNHNPLDELEVLFNKHKDILTEDDKETMKFIIEKRKREIDKMLDGEWRYKRRAIYSLEIVLREIAELYCKNHKGNINKIIDRVSTKMFIPYQRKAER